LVVEVTGGVIAPGRGGILRLPDEGADNPNREHHRAIRYLVAADPVGFRDWSGIRSALTGRIAREDRDLFA